jgi:hypothetical protein
MLHKLPNYLYLIQTLPYDYEKLKSYYDIRIDHKSRSPFYKRNFFTRIKTLEERIDATKIKLEGDKRILLVLSMTLLAQYRSLVQLWKVIEGIKCFRKMTKPIPMARHISPTKEVGEC